MFEKKKNHSLLNAVDDNKTLVNDFRLRSSSPIGFESYRAVDYHLYHKLEEDEMIPRLEEHLSKLFSGEVDDANGDMLDNIIFSAAREGIADLGRQHYDHMDTLRRLSVRSKADCQDLRKIRDARVEELALVQKEYEHICKMMENIGGKKNE